MLFYQVFLDHRVINLERNLLISGRDWPLLLTSRHEHLTSDYNNIGMLFSQIARKTKAFFLLLAGFFLIELKVLLFTIGYF